MILRVKNVNCKHNIKAIKKLRVLIHILNTPQGVSEKSINKAANVMSGRNYPTELQRINDIRLVSPVVKLKDKEGCPYSLYQLLNKDQAFKLVSIIILHCTKYNLPCSDELELNALANRFIKLGEVAA